MAEELAKKAKDALLDEDFDLAVDLYSKAIELDSNSAEFFADRALANIKVESFTEAVADANKAIELDPRMTKAYLRKGTACMKLEEYRTAKVALEKGASIAPEETKFKKLIKECDLQIAEEEKDLIKPASPAVPSSSSTPPPASDGAPGTSSAAAAKPKYRHEFYQKPEEVVVTIFAKGIPKENVVIEFGEQILSVAIDVPGEKPYHFQPRLCGKIIPEKCRFEVLSTKVEIRLTKADVITWNSLEYGRGPTIAHKPNVSSAVSQRPAYPSSKSIKDWDKLEAEVKKEEKEEKLDGDAALNKFFREIYQNADEDMRRAMSKSFVESNGTVLSTNWKEVEAKKVESTPPDGMELKKWEY